MPNKPTACLGWLLLACIALSCHKERSCESCGISNEVPVSIDTGYFVDITLDGQQTVLVSGKRSVKVQPGQWSGDPQLCTTGFHFESIGNINGNTWFCFGLGMLPDHYGYEEVKDAYGKRVYNVSLLDPNPVGCCPCQYIQSGISIFFRDASGVPWVSFGVPSDMLSGKFEITGTGGDSSLVVSASFDCTLYDPQGHSKKLTAGRLRMPVWP